MIQITARQQLVLDFIQRSITEFGYPPTLREICVGLGIRSTNGASDHLDCLERKGYLQRGDMKSRSIRLLAPASPACTCEQSRALRMRVAELEQRLSQIRSAL